MYPPTRYLEWAIRYGGSCKYDLATSGIASGCERIGGDKTLLHDVNGWKRVHEAVARANDVPKEEAVVTLGTAHAVWLAYASLLSPGDEILIEQPAYEPLLNAAVGMGLHVKRFDRLENAGFQLDPEIVARAITQKTKAIVVSNLHNPSGARASHDVLAAIAKTAAVVGATLIVDEVYAPFDELCDDSGIWRHTARKIAPNVVALSSLTKCYGLGSHRIGWLLAPPNVIAHANSALLATCGMLPLGHANLALRAFDVLPDLARRARHRLAEKRNAVAAWVRARSDLHWSAPDSGLFGFVRTRKEGNVRDAIERGMREEQVMVVPGEFFELTHGFRLAWSLDESLVAEALTRLGRVLDSISK